jgi:hypothetical protein
MRAGYILAEISVITVSAFVLPLLSNDRVTLRLEAIFLAFLPSYLLLSISYPFAFCQITVTSVKLFKYFRLLFFYISHIML